MRTRFPIYSKVLILFTVNLVLVGVAVLLLLRQQLSEELDTMLGKALSERVSEISDQMKTEVQEIGLSTWDEALNDFGKTHEVDFFLFSVKGEQLAGETVTLPPRVKDRLGRPRPRDNPPPPRDRPGPRADRPPRPGPRDGRPTPEPKQSNFMVRSEQPAGYWFATRMPINVPGQRDGEPGVLFARTSGLFGPGVLIDLKPWFFLAGGVFVLSAILWFPLVRDLTASVKQMTSATEQIAEGQFDIEVNAGRRDELGRLGTAINRMSGRLEGFIEGQKRFMGDTAHELCAPIARMQMALGILEQRADERSAAYVQDVHEELQHMSGLVNELLSLTKADLAQSAVELVPVDLAPLVDSIISRESKSDLPIDVHIPEETAVVADADLLGRAVSNIIRNSIRYGGDHNRISIDATTMATDVILSIEDTGPGVREEDLPKLFDPFYRVDRVRTRGEGGTGLGLSIVNTCVTACNGSVTVESAAPHGLKLTMTIPSARA